MHRALLIDDEPPARLELRRLLEAHPEIAIVGETGNLTAARARLAADDYDLVFLDIQLIGGNGFDLVPDVRTGARLIFITAYDQHALRAFAVNALDYLLKPVAPDRLAEALRRRGPGPDPGSAVPFSPSPLAPGDLVHVKTGRSAGRFVKLTDIVTLSSDDNYSELLVSDGSSLLVRESLISWEERLPATHFMRVHRQVLVNLARVEGFMHTDDRVTLLRVAGTTDPVAARREHWPDVAARLAALGRPLI